VGETGSPSWLAGRPSKCDHANQRSSATSCGHLDRLTSSKLYIETIRPLFRFCRAEDEQ
jgi:hypothetical protein